MYKLIRLFAPVVLSLFFCGLFAGPGWGEDWGYAHDNTDVEYRLTSNIQQPLVENKITIEVKATYKGEPLGQLEFKQPSPFKILNFKIEQDTMFGIKTGGITNIYEIQVPSRAGTYICTFEGINKAGEKVTFSHSIKIRSVEEQNYISTGMVIGFIVGVAIVASAPNAGANPLATGFGAVLGGVACGYIGGILGEIYGEGRD